jgi:hypothetical protein
MGLDSRGMGSTWVTANIFDRMLRWVPQERSALTQQALNNAYLKLFVDFGQGRKFYVTEKGRMGMVPDVVKKGDEIYLFSGCRVPVVLRQTSDGLALVADCYLHGVMDGQLHMQGDGFEAVHVI